MVFLRTTLVNTVDTTVVQLAGSDTWSTVFDTTNTGGRIDFAPRDDIGTTNTVVVVYGPDGNLLATFNGTNSTSTPVVPETWQLQDTYIRSGSAFPLDDDKGTTNFKASVAEFQVPGVSDIYTQMIVQSLAPSERVVAAYIGIYGILALLILIASALLTRLLVTLTFRGLGQVESTAMSIASGDFSQRMTDVVPGTEVGRLKAAINTMLGRLDIAIRQRDRTVRQMRRFIGDASHELRTPLVTVRGYAELYRMGAIRSDEDVAQAMERIEKEAIRMGVLVEDLLALARLDEKRDVAITPVDLRPIARDAALDLRAASPQREVTVEDTTIESGPRLTVEILPHPIDGPLTPSSSSASSKDEAGRRRQGAATSAIAIAGATLSRLRRRPRTEAADTDAPETPAPAGSSRAPIVQGDENRIRQVVANLLGNARRFTADDSPIGLRVGVDPAAETGWIEIIDHGEGIPEQIRDQIFQRFWRADTSRARETGGSGLGLSIVASIVDALHGTVEVFDTPGGGATFRVSLPLAGEPTREDHAHIETQPLPRLERP